ncbi:hypothetical protein RRG08_017100 [Elysia crispata]|uniref:Uncharacterized protein n=1 Tax=Elysia crispata TaxID=231223 RepID=A0AAE0ZNR0_9GAST|nr:hypothetical protein RRG08_017100 [Elysia crispata]
MLNLLLPPVFEIVFGIVAQICKQSVIPLSPASMRESPSPSQQLFILFLVCVPSLGLHRQNSVDGLGWRLTLQAGLCDVHLSCNGNAFVSCIRACLASSLHSLLHP